MCIILASTAHPHYPLILLSNRDEFLNRPTSPATWWSSPHDHVLAGRDLQAAVHGTWLGITRQGRLAGLTNFRDPDAAANSASSSSSLRSRGEISNAFLTTPPESSETPAEFAVRLLHIDDGATFAGVGGFSFLFGRVAPKSRGGVQLGIMSNRTQSAGGVEWVQQDTWGLSNSYFGDRAWPKVVNGEEMLATAVAEDVKHRGSVATFTEQLFKVLAVDTLPRRKEEEPWETYSGKLRNSVFIPPVGDNKSSDHADTAAETNATPAPNGAYGVYGTQKQTVVLVDHEGKVSFTERTLFDDNAQPVNGDSNVRQFEFDIEGWNN